MGKNTDTLKKAAAPAAAAAVATAPARKTTKKTVRKTPAAKAVQTVAAPAITGEAIALRAYFIAEKRQQLGLPGDSQSDWLEAERQLRAEAKQPKAKAVPASVA
jgi:hypothetical protein